MVSFFMQYLPEYQINIFFNNPRLNSLYLVSACKWVGCIIHYIPLSSLLGSTFPLMSAGLIRKFSRGLWKITCCTLFLQQFRCINRSVNEWVVFINYLGFEGTTQIAGLLNIFIALIVWLTGRSKKTIQLIIVIDESYKKEKMPSQNT